MKKTLIINGNPNENSFSAAIVERYWKGTVNAGKDCEVLHLSQLDFDLVLKGGRELLGQLEPDIEKAQELIKNADHLVFVFPIWWGAYPALMKGFIDRTFLSGFAYKHDEHTKRLVRLLKGKTARLVVTMDTPKWFYSLFYKSFGLRAMKQGLLQYCGISPVRSTVFSPINSAGLVQRRKWLLKVEQMGSESK